MLAAIIVAVLVLHGGSGSGAFVPTGLVGEHRAQAVAQIKAAGLVPNVVEQDRRQASRRAM